MKIKIIPKGEKFIVKSRKGFLNIDLKEKRQWVEEDKASNWNTERGAELAVKLMGFSF